MPSSPLSLRACCLQSLAAAALKDPTLVTKARLPPHARTKYITTCLRLSVPGRAGLAWHEQHAFLAPWLLAQRRWAGERPLLARLRCLATARQAHQRHGRLDAFALRGPNVLRFTYSHLGRPRTLVCVGRHNTLQPVPSSPEPLRSDALDPLRPWMSEYLSDKETIALWRLLARHSAVNDAVLLHYYRQLWVELAKLVRFQPYADRVGRRKARS